MPSTRYEELLSHLVPAFSDARGDITNLLSGIDFNHIALISSVAGTVRGNHVHEKGSQYIYIIQGSLRSYSHHIVQNTPEEWGSSIFLAKAGDLLYCPPMVAHAYFFVTDCLFLNIDTVPRGDGEHYEDTKPWPVLTKEGVIV